MCFAIKYHYHQTYRNTSNATTCERQQKQIISINSLNHYITSGLGL